MRVGVSLVACTRTKCARTDSNTVWVLDSLNAHDMNVNVRNAVTTTATTTTTTTTPTTRRTMSVGVPAVT